MNIFIASALLIAGYLCIIAEVFFPSLGILALFSVLCLSSGVALAFRESAELGWTYLGGALIGGLVTAAGAFKVFPKTPFGKRMIITGPTFANDPAAVDASVRDLLGKSGTAISVLRPAGIVEIEGRRVDCVADGELLPEGSKIVVTALDGNRVVVRLAVSTQPRVE